MKKAVLISISILMALAPGIVHGKKLDVTYNVLLAGGDEPNAIRIWLTPDTRTYVIDSIVRLEVGGSVCENPPDNPNELLCPASTVGSFEVNAGGGNDTVTMARGVRVPVTMRGGPGEDILVGGDAPDKLIGGAGNDRIAGRGGADLIFGGDGDDVIYGGPGRDILRGGPGNDVLAGGKGGADIRQELEGKPRSP